MRVLQIHCSDFEYSLRQETPVSEVPEHRGQRLTNVLVCLICFEKNDEGNEKSIIARFVENLVVDKSRVGCERILLYPYAHLSKSLGSPKLAKAFLHALKEALKEKGLEVDKSPFGWYKAFSMKCIGHPLAEAYREF